MENCKDCKYWTHEDGVCRGVCTSCKFTYGRAAQYDGLAYTFDWAHAGCVGVLVGSHFGCVHFEARTPEDSGVNLASLTRPALAQAYVYKSSGCVCPGCDCPDWKIRMDSWGDAYTGIFPDYAVAGFLYCPYCGKQIRPATARECERQRERECEHTYITDMMHLDLVARDIMARMLKSQKEEVPMSRTHILDTWEDAYVAAKEEVEKEHCPECESDRVTANFLAHGTWRGWMMVCNSCLYTWTIDSDD